MLKKILLSICIATACLAEEWVAVPGGVEIEAEGVTLTPKNTIFIAIRFKDGTQMAIEFSLVESEYRVHLMAQGDACKEFKDPKWEKIKPGTPIAQFYKWLKNQIDPKASV